MNGLHCGDDGSDADDVEGCSLDELAARIGSAITRMIGALREELGPGGEPLVRRWISRLDPEARAELMALLLTDRWVPHSAAIGRAILRGEAWPAPGRPRRRAASGPVVHGAMG